METDLHAPVHFNGNSSGIWRYKASIHVLGYMVEDVVYIRPPDWWPEQIPEGYVLLLLKSIRVYGTLQAARKWHERISSSS